MSLVGPGTIPIILVVALGIGWAVVLWPRRPSAPPATRPAAEPRRRHLVAVDSLVNHATADADAHQSWRDLADAEAAPPSAPPNRATQ